MQLGMIGLGRMGANIVRRVAASGHECVVYDHSPDAVKAMASEERTTGVYFVGRAGREDGHATSRMGDGAGGHITTSVIEELAKTLEPGDIVIDGGNSYYRDDIKHAKMLSEKGIHLLDCGTSGGVWGRERGYCLMIGGETMRSPTPSRSSPPSHRGWTRRRAPRAEPARSRHQRRVTCTAGRPEQATSSRWCTTASSTG